MYIIDTDICIYWLKGNRNIARRIENQGIENISVTIITACELYFGAYNSQKKDRNIAAPVTQNTKDFFMRPLFI